MVCGRIRAYSCTGNSFANDHSTFNVQESSVPHLIFQRYHAWRVAGLHAQAVCHGKLKDVLCGICFLLVAVQLPKLFHFVIVYACRRRGLAVRHLVRSRQLPRPLEFQDPVVIALGGKRQHGACYDCMLHADAGLRITADQNAW